MMNAMSTAHSSIVVASKFFSAFLPILFLIVAFQVPVAMAQSSASQPDNDLRAAVQMLLLEDPRAAHLPQKEFDGMVDALVKAAEKKGLSAHDVSWRPQPVEIFSQNASVGEIGLCSQNSILCMINEAFGFTGSDMTIPIWFGICSAILVLIVGGMIEVHRRRHLAPSVPQSLQK